MVWSIITFIFSAILDIITVSRQSTLENARNLSSSSTAIDSSTQAQLSHQTKQN